MNVLFQQLYIIVLSYEQSKAKYTVVYQFFPLLG